MKNRNTREPQKRAERQVQTPGKLPFHRVNKLQKVQQQLAPLDQPGKKKKEEA